MAHTLFVFGNPHPERSAFAQALEMAVKHLGHSTLHLASHCINGKFDVPAMQDSIAGAEQIVLHAPVYWYSVPALVKAWMDQLLTPGWAFPADGSQLRGKRIAMSLTVGAPLASYAPGGSNRHPVDAYFLPFERAFEYCGMEWRGTLSLQIPQGKNAIQAAASEHVELLVSRISAPV